MALSIQFILEEFVINDGVYCSWRPDIYCITHAISGAEVDTEDTSNDTSSLADIMMAEKTKVKKSSAPIRIQHKKSVGGTTGQNR